MLVIVFDSTRRGVTLQLDVAKKNCPIKYKNCNNAPTHSQISTEGIPQHAVYPALPSREQGALQQQWEEKALLIFKDLSKLKASMNQRLIVMLLFSFFLGVTNLRQRGETR